MITDIYHTRLMQKMGHGIKLKGASAFRYGGKWQWESYIYEFDDSPNLMSLLILKRKMANWVTALSQMNLGRNPIYRVGDFMIYADEEDHRTLLITFILKNTNHDSDTTGQSQRDSEET